MTQYVCPRCNYTTDRKSSYMMHLNKIKVCAVIHEDISIEDLRERYGMSRTHDRHSCKYCNKEFTSRGNLNTHVETCKAKSTLLLKQKVSDLSLTIQNKEIEDSNTIVVDATVMKGIIECNKQLVEKVDHLERENKINKKKKPQIVNNINNINNLNIQINSFGKESMEYITKEFFMNCFNQGMRGVANLISETHFNDEHPENQNVRLRSLNNKIVEVMDNNEWVPKDLNITLDTIISSSQRQIMVHVTPMIQPNEKTQKTEKQKERETYSLLERMSNIRIDTPKSKRFLLRTTRDLLLKKRDRVNNTTNTDTSTESNADVDDNENDILDEELEDLHTFTDEYIDSESITV